MLPAHVCHAAIAERCRRVLPCRTDGSLRPHDGKPLRTREHHQARRPRVAGHGGMEVAATRRRSASRKGLAWRAGAGEGADSRCSSVAGQRLAVTPQVFLIRPSRGVCSTPSSHFVDAPHYYSTLFHELVHSTGNESRLKRTFGDRVGDRLYSKEELVAEMGAAFLCAIDGISHDDIVTGCGLADICFNPLRCSGSMLATVGLDRGS